MSREARKAALTQEEASLSAEAGSLQKQLVVSLRLQGCCCHAKHWPQKVQQQSSGPCLQT